MAPPFSYIRGCRSSLCQSAVPGRRTRQGNSLNHAKGSSPLCPGKDFLWAMTLWRPADASKSSAGKRGWRRNSWRSGWMSAPSIWRRSRLANGAVRWIFWSTLPLFSTPASTIWCLERSRTARFGRSWTPLSKPWRLCGRICDWS